MSNEITQEEREQIIANIKDNLKCFFGLYIAEAIQANYDDDNECWDKLLALIESAPAKRNMKAAELVDKLESKIGNDDSLTYRIEEVLNINHDSSYDDTTRELCNVLRNLDAPEDCMKWPLDKDGVPIKPGEIVYLGEEDYEVKEIKIILNECTGDSYFHIVGAKKDSGFDTSPCYITHKKPRTLDDIIREMQDAFNHDLLRTDLINEAYELGKAAGNEEASEV